ncbi:RNA polymerase sigma factor [Oceanicoccus sagamiensis]|uniref:RNA polymerase sigma factor n=1 Tax=Oceanicoccus sagamiensis TaxID=716816 RepID=A0A1X9NFS7_9GAMM|nr:sigma-70 family RNA polymerase sigma factor [Oceanicoccus sagamiensis]ARN73807.1 hypothetical protein BST96_06585 [Oceanicoccus sagamiensis]
MGQHSNNNRPPERETPAAKAGPERGMVETFLSCELAIKRFLARLLYRPEDVDEITQETFLVAYNANSKRTVHSPKAYLFKVAKNIALRELTRKSTKMTDYLEDALAQNAELIEGNATLESEVMAQQTLAGYCNAIASLPPQCRKVFILRKVQAKSHREIAASLNISVSAVEKHIALGVKKFDAYMLSQEGQIPPQAGVGPTTGSPLPKEQQ